MKCSQSFARVVLQFLLLLLTLTSASCNINQARPKQGKKPADKLPEKLLADLRRDLAQAIKGKKLTKNNWASVQAIHLFLKNRPQKAVAVLTPLRELARQEGNAEAVLAILGGIVLKNKDVREKGLHVLEDVSEELKYEHFLSVLKILDQVLDQEDNSEPVRSYAEDLVQWLTSFLVWMRPYLEQHDKKNYDAAETVIQEIGKKPTTSATLRVFINQSFPKKV